MAWPHPALFGVLALWAAAGLCEERRYDLTLPAALDPLRADGWRTVPYEGVADAGADGAFFMGAAASMELPAVDGGAQPWSRVLDRWTVEAEVDPGQCPENRYGAILDLRDQRSWVQALVGGRELVVYQAGGRQPAARFSLRRDAGEGGAIRVGMTADGGHLAVRLEGAEVGALELLPGPPLFYGMYFGGDWRKSLRQLSERDPRQLRLGTVDACPVPARWRSFAYAVPEGDQGGRREWPESPAVKDVLEPLALPLPTAQRRQVLGLRIKRPDAACAAAAALDVAVRQLMPLSAKGSGRDEALRALPPQWTRAERLASLSQFPDAQRWRGPLKRIRKLPICDRAGPNDCRDAKREETVEEYGECLCKTDRCRECVRMAFGGWALLQQDDADQKPGSAWEGEYPRGLESSERLEPWPPTYEYRFEAKESGPIALAIGHSLVWDASLEHLREAMRALGVAFGLSLSERRPGAPAVFETLKQRMVRARSTAEGCR